MIIIQFWLAQQSFGKQIIMAHEAHWSILKQTWLISLLLGLGDYYKGGILVSNGRFLFLYPLDWPSYRTSKSLSNKDLAPPEWSQLSYNSYRCICLNIADICILQVSLLELRGDPLSGGTNHSMKGHYFLI